MGPFIFIPQNLIFINSWCQVREIATNPLINISKKWKHYIFLSILSILGITMELLGIFLATAPILEQYSQSKVFVNIFVVGFIPASFNMLIVLPPWILLSSMTQHVEEEIFSISKYSTTREVREMVLIFDKYQKAFNLPALINLSARYETRQTTVYNFEKGQSISYLSLCSSQICWIVVSFLAIGLAIGANQLSLMPLTISMIGFILHTFMFLFLFKIFLFQLHDVNKSRRNLTEAVEDMKDIDDEEKRLLLRDIDNLEPVSAFGLFNIDRSTLTSMISISLTYIIILIQFKQNSI